MKFLRTTIATAFALLLSIQVVSADIMVKVVFNNGNNMTSDAYCSPTDFEKIDEIFTWENVNRRHLRRTSYDSYASRELATYSTICKNYCKGFARGTCRATRCVGYRRSLSRVRRNEQATTCSVGLSSVQTQLNTLISDNLVTNTCKTFLSSSTRNATCLDEVVYGEVEGYRIWNTTTSSSPHIIYESDNMTLEGGYSFCKRTKFNVEIITNDCVENLRMVLRGPDNYVRDRTEGFIPYTLFKSSSNDNTDISNGKVVLSGNTLDDVGSYSVTAIPDGTSRKKTQFKFTLLNC